VAIASRAIDAGDLLDRGGWTSFQKFLTAVAALAVIFDGFDIQVLGFTIPGMMREWHADRASFGPVLAIGLVAMAAGSPMAGYLGDRFGRRVTLAGCVALFGAGTIATAFVHGLAGLTAMRIVIGIGTGGALPNATALAAEFAPLPRRAMAVKWTIVCVPLGGMLGGFVAARVLPEFGWRSLYAIGGMLPLLLAVVLLWVLPESPRFMVRRPEYWPRLENLLRRLGHSVPAGSVFVDKADSAERQTVSVRALFEPGFARDTAGLWAAFFFSSVCIYLTFGWLPSLLTARGLDVAAASSGLAVYNFGGVLGVLLWSVLITAWGSRVPLVAGSVGAAVSAVALLSLGSHAGPDQFLLTAGLGISGLLTNAVQVALFALAAHLYPTGVRATGVAYMAAVGRIGGVLSSIFGSLLIQAGGAFWIAYAVAMLCACAGVFEVRRHIPGSRKISAAS
jgi:AAHS family 4-hydroxybenzoate transporter-like MFS transporter